MAFGADEDRAYFGKKWGFGVSDPEYSAAAGDLNFRAKWANINQGTPNDPTAGSAMIMVNAWLPITIHSRLLPSP